MAHYCEGVVVGDHLYAAGQIASDYTTGVPPEACTDPAFPYYGSDIQRQTRYVLENLQKTFRAAGAELKDVVKSQVFLCDLDDFFYFDQVWKEFVPDPPPRTTVEVGGLLVPGCLVEIDLVALKGNVPRQVITKSGAPSPMAHYCEGVVVGDHLYAAGQIASDYATGVPPEARTDPAFPYYGSDIQRQTRYVLENLQKTFRAAGAELKDVVKSQVFLTDLDDFFHFDQVWREFFPDPPPRSTVEVGGLLVPGCRVEIDLIAVKSDVPRQVTTESGAPKTQAHYCEAMVVGDHVYAAGQLAADYASGVSSRAHMDPAFPYYGSDIQRQTRYVLENLQKTFRAAGAELKDVVKSQVFLTDLDDFFYFDQVWKEFFPDPPPRTTVEVSGLLVPGCRVEIDLVAVIPR